MGELPITLTRHIIEQKLGDPASTEEFAAIMAQFALTAKIIARDVSQAGLIDVLGSTGETNIQGETVQKLDRKANETFVRAFQYSGSVRTLISEEMERPLHIGGGASGRRPGQYALFFDPLDGSSNIDVNAVVGSIFSVHRLADSTTVALDGELLKRGTEQVAAGYALYGPSTQLLYTCGAGVHQFTLDPGIGEFVLSASNLRMPSRGRVYSVNEGNYRKWPATVQQFVEYLRERDPATNRPYSSRYSGCLVADVHRLLFTGGIYLYPGELGKPDGKLRLMYEAAPLALLVEQAGGGATTGTDRILDIRPTALHQRVPLFIGSREELMLAEEFIRGLRGAAVAATAVTK
jgi:fructose-1,6-bisphosphatase I